MAVSVYDYWPTLRLELLLTKSSINPMDETSWPAEHSVRRVSEATRCSRPATAEEASVPSDFHFKCKLNVHEAATFTAVRVSPFPHSKGKKRTQHTIRQMLIAWHDVMFVLVRRLIRGAAVRNMARLTEGGAAGNRSPVRHSTGHVWFWIDTWTALFQISAMSS